MAYCHQSMNTSKNNLKLVVSRLCFIYRGCLDEYLKQLHVEHTTTAKHCYFLPDFVLSSRIEVHKVSVFVSTKRKENYSQRTFSCSLLYDLCMHCMYVSRSESSALCCTFITHWMRQRQEEWRQGPRRLYYYIFRIIPVISKHRDDDVSLDGALLR